MKFKNKNSKAIWSPVEDDRRHETTREQKKEVKETRHEPVRRDEKKNEEEQVETEGTHR